MKYLSLVKAFDKMFYFTNFEIDNQYLTIGCIESASNFIIVKVI